MKKWLIAVLILLALLLCSIGLNCYQYSHPQYETEIVEKVDTFNIYNDRIVEKTVYKYSTIFDTTVVYVDNLDTVYIPIEVPIDHKVYTDTLTADKDTVEVTIGYSGFKAEIDSILVIPHFTETIVKPQKKVKMGQSLTAGVQVGYGVTLSQTPSFTPYIGLGVTYGFGITW